jgi:hypothetical protein
MSLFKTIMISCKHLQLLKWVGRLINYFISFKYLQNSGLIRGEISLEGDNLLVFCYLDDSEIWFNKRVSFSGRCFVTAELVYSNDYMNIVSCYKMIWWVGRLINYVVCYNKTKLILF